MRKGRGANRGDTIVEVTIAFAVFSAVSIAAIMLMNRGLGIAQQSLETTLVRQQIDAQADLVRYARDQHSTAWDEIIALKHDATSKPVSTDDLLNNPSSCDQPPQKAFSLYYQSGALKVRQHSSGAAYQSPAMHSYVDTQNGVSNGLWMEITDAQGSTPSSRAYDVYIRACWYAPSLDKPMVTGTIVRLYGT